MVLAVTLILRGAAFVLWQEDSRAQVENRVGSVFSSRDLDSFAALLLLIKESSMIPNH